MLISVGANYKYFTPFRSPIFIFQIPCKFRVIDILNSLFVTKVHFNFSAMKYVITTISSFLMIHHKAVNCKQLWSKFSKCAPCKIFCALHTFEYGVSRHWKRKGDGIILFTYIKKNKWTYIFWYIYRNWSNLTILFSWFLLFLIRATKSTKMANIYIEQNWSTYISYITQYD